MKAKQHIVKVMLFETTILAEYMLSNEGYRGHQMDGVLCFQPSGTAVRDHKPPSLLGEFCCCCLS